MYFIIKLRNKNVSSILDQVINSFVFTKFYMFKYNENIKLFKNYIHTNIYLF